MVEKYYNEKGEVGVIYSPGYGAGFSTWHEDKNICFDKNVIQMILDNDQKGVENYCKENGIYYDGDQLEVRWLQSGTAFIITEYDGYETVEIMSYPDSFQMA